MRRCHRHQFDHAVGECHDCGSPGCETCIVQIPRIGAMCVPCALKRSGVRPGRRGQRAA